MIPINILINNETILDDIDSCSIKMSEGSFCNIIDLSFKSQKFWNNCDPTTDFGELRLKVIIGETTYEFLCEERSSSVSNSGLGFSVWGRSKQALLSSPYSKTISDTESTSYPWQTGVTTASNIISYVVSNFCPYSVTVDWNVGDFSIYEDSFSVSNQTPIEIISAITNIIGAELKANNDGSLSIETYSVTEGDAVASYTDLDDIVELNESIEHSSGFNSVTVFGYDQTEASKSSYLSVEAVTDSTICPGRSQTVKVYYYHSAGNVPVCYFENGSYQNTGSGTEEFTEDVQLIWGHGNTSKQNTNGETEVTGDESVPLDIVSVTYSTNYKQFSMRADVLVGEYSAIFYFEDKSAYSVHTITVEACGDGEEVEDDVVTDAWDMCGSVVVEKESPNTIYPGDTVDIYVYGNRIVTSANSEAGRVFSAGSSKKTKTETITFTNGAASLAYPVESIVSYSGFSRPQHKRGSNKLKINSYVGVDRKLNVTGTISYTTKYNKYRVKVPGSWEVDAFKAWFNFSGCSTITLSLSVEIEEEEENTRDITINVKDYVSDITVDESDIYIDGSFSGTTTDGALNVEDVAVGDRTIKIISEGYLDSDLDDLDNDNFTVSA